ncbi:MAG: gliding motility-associated ABC transporter substrate-binding protein GldG [Bacteroidota bacterium]
MKGKRKNLIQFLLLLVLIIVVNFISSNIYHRIDLTADNRYTLKPKTKEILRELDDVVYFKIYLTGDMPIGLKRMQNRIQEMLNEFRVHAGDNIQYQFINPSEGRDSKERERFYKDLRDKGLEPTNVKSRDKEGGYSQKMIFPGAIVNCGEQQTALNLLKNNPRLSSDRNLNHSIQELEYNLLDAVYKLTLDEKQSIAFITGHGELDEYHVGDISKTLSDYYEVDRIQMDGITPEVYDYETLVVAKPQKEFSKEEKYTLDQYLMNGGSIFWFIDRVDISIDSLSMKSSTMANISQLNLEDQLFKYGVRINPDLIQDIQCAIIPVNTSYSGNEPDFSPSPWVYYPLLSSPGNHPINKNLNMVKSRFVSSIDTLPANPGLDKTILLTSSDHSKTIQVPAMVSLGEIEKKISRASFQESHKVTGVLLEGNFHSVFENQIVSDMENKTKRDFREASNEARMIVISDGDLIKNRVTHKGGKTMITPLGYDRYTKQTYGNKDFIVNSIHYMTNKKSLISIRGKEIEMRLLDRARVSEERVKWQVVNILIPVMLIVVFGLTKNIIRRRKHTSFKFKER